MNLPFRFNAEKHEYSLLDGGTVLPHITQLLELSGWVDPTHYTEESRIRGTAVHEMCAAYDQQSLPVDGCESVFKPYLLGHVSAMAMLRPEIISVELPCVHPVYRFGGRPDRVVRLSGLRGVYELKSGHPEKAHPIQLALQALLDSVECGIPPENLGRWCCYLKPSGKFSIEVFDDRRDLDVAREILLDYARS